MWLQIESKFCLKVNSQNLQILPGTVESICRAASRNSGKVLVTSCQSNFGPSCGAARVVSILPGVVKRSGIAVRLLLAEAGLIFLRGPEQDLGGVNPAIRVGSFSLI